MKKRILEFIYQYYDLHGFLPSYKEIAFSVNLKSLSTINYYIKKLETEGFLKRMPGRHRAFILPKKDAKIEYKKPDC